jgi:hypothetical protein
MVKGGVKTPDRMDDALDCLGVLSELEEDARAASSPSHEESDGCAAPLSGKLVIT